MAGIPVTRNEVSRDRADAIRQAVRTAEILPAAYGDSLLARPEHAAGFYAFLSDPAIHTPIYSLPALLTEASVREFIIGHEAERAAGEGLLFLSLDPSGAVAGYSDIQIWPRWAAAEMGGALRADRQSQGQGAAGAIASFTWIFDTLGLELICETAALDNNRTARLLDAIGFQRMGEVTSHREDGTTRPSLVWEVSRQAWFAHHGQDQSRAGAPSGNPEH